MKNPFTPSFGQIPCCLAGRDTVVNELLYAYQNAPGDPGLTTILVGARGTGKTALLTYISKQAAENGWISADVSCMKGMMRDIYLQALHKGQKLAPLKSTRITEMTLKASAVIFDAEMKLESADSLSDWRMRMSDLLEVLNEKGIGLLITVDEVDPSVEEMITFSSLYQHFIREERKIGLLMAGLPFNVSSLLTDTNVSFLRRANQRYLGRISDFDIGYAFDASVKTGNKQITKEALNLAVKAINGFPYMMQLVGYKSFSAADDKEWIGTEEIKTGIHLAEDDMKHGVLRSTLDEVSAVGLLFLKAMLPDEQMSSLKNLAERMGKTSNYISGYKKKLCELGIIDSPVRGKVCFSLPLIREYLPEYLENVMGE